MKEWKIFAAETENLLRDLGHVCLLRITRNYVLCQTIKHPNLSERVRTTSMADDASMQWAKTQNISKSK